MTDPGLPPQDGGLLIAPLGKGTYVYTGLAFFRQLPAGVPGAFRLFVNLLALGELSAVAAAVLTFATRRCSRRKCRTAVSLDESRDVGLDLGRGVPRRAWGHRSRDQGVSPEPEQIAQEEHPVGQRLRSRRCRRCR